MAKKLEGRKQLTMVIGPVMVLPAAYAPKPTPLILGVLEGGNKLLKPRVYTLFNDPKDGKELQHMAPLPGCPDFVIVEGLPRYPFPDEPMNARAYDLYIQITTPPPESAVPAIGDPSLN